MASDCTNHYVRESKMVDGDYVFFLGNDENILHASRSMCFAGDATFRTVATQGRWYLYNIVTAGSTDRLNDKGIVVLRALMTGLTKGFYYAIWKYFFQSIARASNLLRDVALIEHGGVRVPYIKFPPSLVERTCLVTSITMDFDCDEIHGCAEALRSVCGGSVDLHLEYMFVGCAVHLQQDLLRQAWDAEKQRENGMTERELLAVYKGYVDVKSPEEVTVAFQKIKNVDSGWSNWVVRQGMGPLICEAQSRMSPAARSLSFPDTNFVESQNRRGNIYIGTHNRPGEAALKLQVLDKADQVALGDGVYNQICKARCRRNRSDSILRPSSGPAPSTTKRRSKTGGGPLPKKPRVLRSVNNTRTVMKGRTSDESVHGDGSKGSSDIVKKGSDHSLHEHVLNMLAEFDKKLDTFGPLEEREGDARQLRERRMDVLVTVLTSIHAAGGDVQCMRNILLESMQLHSRDVCFRKELLKVFLACLSPKREHSTCDPSPVAAGTAPNNVDTNAHRSNEEM